MVYSSDESMSEDEVPLTMVLKKKKAAIAKSAAKEKDLFIFRTTTERMERSSSHELARVASLPSSPSVIF